MLRETNWRSVVCALEKHRHSCCHWEATGSGKCQTSLVSETEGDEMARDPKEMLNELMRGLGAVAEVDSQRTQAYLQFVEASEKPGALDGKVKQLIGLSSHWYLCSLRLLHCISYQ